MTKLGSLYLQNDPALVHRHPNIEEVYDDEAIGIYKQLKLKDYKQRDEWQ